MAHCVGAQVKLFESHVQCGVSSKKLSLINIFCACCNHEPFD